MNPNISKTLSSLKDQKQAVDTAMLNMHRMLVAVEKELIKLDLCIPVAVDASPGVHLVFSPQHDEARPWLLGFRRNDGKNTPTYFNSENREHLIAATRALPALLADLEEKMRARTEETVDAARVGLALFDGFPLKDAKP